MAFELLCVRHGRTAWNLEHRFQGHTDVPLDDEGRAQAQALAVRLAAERIDRAYVSDLSRARETAESIVAGRSLSLHTLVDLREMSFGAWEGLTWTQIVERWPEHGQGQWDRPKFYTPEGGESFAQAQVRAANALRLIAADAREGDVVLVVTHAGMLHALLHVLVGGPEADALAVRFSPASFTRFAVEGERGRLLTLNETAGL